MGRARLLSERRVLACLVAGGMLAERDGQVWAHARPDARALLKGLVPRHILHRLQAAGKVRPLPGQYGRHVFWNRAGERGETDGDNARLARVAPPCPPVGAPVAVSLLEAGLALAGPEIAPRLRAAAGRLGDDLVRAAGPLSQGRAAVDALAGIEAGLGLADLRLLEAALIDRASPQAAAWRQETTEDDMSRRMRDALQRLAAHYALVTA